VTLGDRYTSITGNKPRIDGKPWNQPARDLLKELRGTTLYWEEAKKARAREAAQTELGGAAWGGM